MLRCTFSGGFMKKEKICRSRILAFLLSLLMVIFVAATGILISAKTGILKGNFGDLFKSEEVGETLKDLVKESINDEALGDSFAHKDAVTDELVDGITDVMIDAMFGEEGEVSLDKVEEEINKEIDRRADEMLNEFMSEADTAGDSFSAKDSEFVKKYADEYDVELSDEFYGKLDEYAAGGGEAEKQAFKDSMTSYLDDEVLEEVKQEVADAMTEAEVEINEAVIEFRRSDDLTSVTNVFDGVSKLVGFALLVMVILSLAMFAFQFMVYKRHGYYAPFRNLAIAFGISSLPCLLMGVMAPFVKEVMGTEYVDGMDITAIMDKFVDLILKPFMTVGIFYIVLMVVCIVASIVLKKTMGQKIEPPASTPNYSDMEAGF